MMLTATFSLRKECPPGACTCERERLHDAQPEDLRILRLTKEEEKRLVARLEAVTSLAELRQLQRRMQDQLGMVLRIEPGAGEVRTVRGLDIALEAQPGLCRKTRQAIPAAVRRCLENNPSIVYTLLHERDLFGGM